MNPSSPRIFPLLVALLLGLSACSSESTATDAAVDTGSTTDTPRTDVPSSDVPSADVPMSDIPTIDIPATDVPRVDVPAVDTPMPADACARPDIVRIPPRLDCGPRADSGACPTGYECLSFSGVVLQQFCGRSCRSDCDCATGEHCGSYTDKAGTHPLCVADTNG